MIQRIQTLYMLLAIVAAVLCMCNPVGVILAEDSTPLADLYNLWLSVDPESNGVISHVVMPWASLFALLALVCTLLTIGIFLFKKRALQMRVVNLSMLLLIGYYIAGLAFIMLFNHDNGLPLLSSFRPTVWVAMPFVALVLSYLAFRGILKDQLLIKSLDRLR